MVGVNVSDDDLPYLFQAGAALLDLPAQSIEGVRSVPSGIQKKVAVGPTNEITIDTTGRASFKRKLKAVYSRPYFHFTLLTCRILTCRHGQQGAPGQARRLAADHPQQP